MKKSLLIILMTLLGFTGYAQPVPFIRGCIGHTTPYFGSSTLHHIYTITLGPTSSGLPMDLYIGGVGPYTQVGPATFTNPDWAYEFDLGPVVGADAICRNIKIVPQGTPQAQVLAAPPYQICHCDWNLRDACLYGEIIGGQHHVMARVVFGPDVQGLDKYIWYWDGTSVQGLFSPTGKIQDGVNWIYTYDLGSLTTLSPTIDLYVSDGTPSVSDPHITAGNCHTEALYACTNFLPVNGGGPLHRIVTVVYDAGLAGQDVYLWLWWGGSFPSTGALPISKVCINGYWKYTYDLGPVSPSEPGCYELYWTMANVVPTYGSDPSFLACGICHCDVTFSYCINPLDPPYKVTFDAYTANPTRTITITVNGMMVYNGPHVDKITHTFPGPGTYNVCVNSAECNYCMEICLTEETFKQGAQGGGLSGEGTIGGEGSLEGQ